ncbi:chloride channel protein [Suttonella ornithocola]|uniref:Chloride channel protein n=1 Tax=Suttonella ornithocola TaxID=279832 RepID=A0A380N0D3_9GAMM|nr:chloride channel protein [Suttonella ornithocola]SUO97207.1 chloride channel protein [Suttonella ornithocola]
MHPNTRLRAKIAHKTAQTKRLSKHTFETLFLIIGAGLVALCALLFAKTADFALEMNAKFVQHFPLAAWIILPFGMMFINYLTRSYAPYTSGSGIPQVIAAIHLPYSSHKTRLVQLKETLLKIPLTFLGMLCGASIGREGPSVQVGAAVMVSWGKWCKKRNLAFKGLEENNLLAISVLLADWQQLLMRLLQVLFLQSKNLDEEKPCVGKEVS